jgi:glutathione peroxidase
MKKIDMEKIYDFKALNNKGEEVDFKQFEGKVLMIVNTASKCGFTPQYDGLEELYQRYKDLGLVIIGFPCDQFAHQEPGSNEEIAEFCRLNHGVTFPLMAKIEVNGDNAHPIYQYLKKAAPGVFGGFIKWNFTKFLISRDGTVIKRYAPTIEPKRMEKDIQDML